MMKKDALVQELVDGYGNWVADETRARAAMGRMTRELYPYDAMFSPIRVNRLTLKNRLVMAPMGNLDMCEETGRPNDKMLQYFFARAKGGTGLLTTGLIPVSHGIDPSVTEPGQLSYFPRIDRSRTVFSGWRDLAQGVHAFGSRIFIQLTPGLGRVGNPQCLVSLHRFPVSASWNPNFYISQIPCAPLSDAKLKKIIQNGGQAAADAQAAGIDGAYLHGHEGYLLEQMTNPAFNRRTFGAYADWQRFGLDLVREIRARTGPDYPIMYRIDLSLALNETYGDTMREQPALRRFTNGRTVQDTLGYLENLVRAGVDLFDVDLGCYDNWWLPHPPAGMPAGCFLRVAKTVRDHFESRGIVSNAGIRVPVAAVGKLGYPDLAEKALRDGMCDMVMLGRPLLADPEWPNKAYAGEVADICPCIGCQEGCINEFVEGGHPQCAVNPRTGFEDVRPAALPPVAHAKKIAVVGGGPAGVNFALLAGRRGHIVDLYEKGEIGGKAVPGSVPRGKFDVENYLRYLRGKLYEAVTDGVVQLRREEATAASLAVRSYDAIVTATGTRAVALRLDGIEQVRTVQAADLLVNPELLGSVRRVVVIGGGTVGCETAFWLRYEHRRDVCVVELLPHFMEGACTANRAHLLYYMKQSGVHLYNCAQVTGFGKNLVYLRRNTHKSVPDPCNTWQPVLPKNVPNPLAPKAGSVPEEETLPAELVVFALGGRPDDTLYYELLSAHAAKELYNIGDSFAGGRILEATRAAYSLAEKI